MENVKADSVYKNGKIYTVDEKMSIQEAIAVKDGKIIGVGKNEEMEPYISDSRCV